MMTAENRRAVRREEKLREQERIGEKERSIRDEKQWAPMIGGACNIGWQGDSYRNQ